MTGVIVVGVGFLVIGVLIYVMARLNARDSRRYWERKNRWNGAAGGAGAGGTGLAGGGYAGCGGGDGGGSGCGGGGCGGGCS